MKVRREQILGNRWRDHPSRIPVETLDPWFTSEDKEVVWELAECLAELEVPWTVPPLGRSDCLDRLERLILTNPAGRYWAGFMMLSALRKLARDPEAAGEVDRRLGWLRRAATHPDAEISRCAVASVLEHLPEDPALRERFLAWKGEPDGDSLLSTARWSLSPEDLAVVEELLGRGTPEICGNLLNTLSLLLIPEEEITREFEEARNQILRDLPDLGRSSWTYPGIEREAEPEIDEETLERIRRIAEGFRKHPSPWVSGNATEALEYITLRRSREQQGQE